MAAAWLKDRNNTQGSFVHSAGQASGSTIRPRSAGPSRAYYVSYGARPLARLQLDAFFSAGEAPSRAEEFGTLGWRAAMH